VVGRRRRVTWTAQARDALSEILSYIAQDSASAAQRAAKEFIQVTGTLDTLSERGRVVPELEDSSIRELLVQSYRVIYQIKSNEVRVLTLVHQARDFARFARDMRPPPSGPAG